MSKPVHNPSDNNKKIQTCKREGREKRQPMN